MWKSIFGSICWTQCRLPMACLTINYCLHVCLSICLLDVVFYTAVSFFFESSVIRIDPLNASFLSLRSFSFAQCSPCLVSDENCYASLMHLSVSPTISNQCIVGHHIMVLFGQLIRRAPRSAIDVNIMNESNTKWEWPKWEIKSVG